MAEIQDVEQDSLVVDAPEAEQVKDEQPEATPAVETPNPEDELDMKYRGKSAAEIAKMHREAEKLIARQANEVGEIRKLADELLRSQLAKPQKQEEVQPEVDFFADPKEAIRRAVESNPRVQAAEQRAIEVQRMYAQQMLLAKHPDMPKVVLDPEFQDWVKASRVRTKLFEQADNYDVDAAEELLTTFKMLNPRRQATQRQPDVQIDRQARDQMVKTAAVDTGGSGESGKKLYRRADLIRLKMRDPGKYDAMQDEISLAYAEGRVK